jgi:hypothetical protein
MDMEILRFATIASCALLSENIESHLILYTFLSLPEYNMIQHFLIQN